ncbi:hypothetical protein EI94DRAFT_618017 [Lactarius quietus]|nr:hypothetical protein EI94DRAFT_618017 [Lactarius quietus]
MHCQRIRAGLGRDRRVGRLLPQIGSTTQKLGGERARCHAFVVRSGFQRYHVRVDEKAGICITAPIWGGVAVIHLFSSITLWRLPKSYLSRSYYCDYSNGYLVFDNQNSETEIWRLASDFATEDKVAADSPPNDKQIAMSARAAAMYHQYAPLGQFRPWAFAAASPDPLPKPISTQVPHAHMHKLRDTFLYDVRTGSLEQKFNLRLRQTYESACDVD